MPKRPLRVDQALRLLPEVDALADLRDALVGGSREDGERAWAASGAYARLDTRVADAAALESRVEALAERARERAERVLRLAARALRAAEEGDTAGAARALVAAGEAEEAERRWDEAEGWYRKAAEVGRRPRDRSAEGLALRRLGRVARSRGRPARALELYRRGYDVAAAQRDAEGMVTACQGMGNALVDQGRWAEAREWYRRGLEHLGGAPPSPARVQLCNSMAVVERRLGRAEESAAWLDRGEEAARAAGDRAGEGYVRNARARLLLEQGDLRGAEDAFRRALEAELDPAARTGVMINLAEPLLLQGRLAEAEHAAREAEREAIRHRVVLKLPDVYRTLGEIARARGDEDGMVFFEQALEVIREHRLPPFEEAATQHRYALFEAARGQPEQALARLAIARDTYRALGARLDEEKVAADLERVAATTTHDGGER